MAVDEALLHSFQEDEMPILRLYRWKDSLSLGRFSKIKESVDMETLCKKKLPLVRRMTGGGILVHGGDLSYSLILPREHYKHGGVKESYRHLCSFLINFYEKLGFNAGFAQDLNLESSKSNICMASHEPYDIIIDGKKMGGNAQRYTSHVLFQHGSIPISLNDAIFDDVFFEESGLKNTSTLQRMKKDVTQEQLTSLLLESFAQSFDATLIKDTLNLSEQRNADDLLIHKYNQKSWNIDAKHNKT
jgi:lipoyl(octanoyl) transferase